MSPKEKKELSDEEKEYKSMRKKIQEKLIKFATRIPVFMYLTDYRERSLKDVITQLEPGLFKKVTGVDVKDFELLVSLNVFNGSLMNDAIYKFKRYEDSSLSYTGIDKHEGEDIGGWDTVIKRQEYERLFFNQQDTMEAPAQAADDIPENPFAFVADTEEDEEEAPPVTAPKKKKAAPAPSPRPQASSQERISAGTGVIRASRPSTASFAPKPAAPAAKQPDKPKVDTSVVTVGSKLTHKKFGEGTVVELKKGMVTVRFAEGEKKFVFPQAIKQGFLSIP